MVRFIACFAFALLTFNVAMAGDEKQDTLPPCEGQGCRVVAKIINLPEAPATKDLKIRMGSMIVEIPSHVTRIDFAKSVTVFRYETSPPVMMSVETDETLPFLKDKSQPVSLFEAMHIIFTKTLKDRDITGKYDTVLLNRLMWSKKELLERSGEAYVYKRGRITVFYAPRSGDPHKNVAWAFDSNHPDAAIRLESDRHQNDFLKILYSIRLIEELEK